MPSARISKALSFCQSFIGLMPVLLSCLLASSTVYGAPEVGAAPLPKAFVALTPLSSGPGVVVGDPVVDATTLPEVADFGAGCTRWLQLELSNHQELGKTPDWTQLAPTIKRAGWPDWRLTPERALQLARSMGVTHLVTSRIEGSATEATLSLQIVSAPEGQAVGDPIVLKGSYDAINAALPSTVGAILAVLGVQNATVPANSSLKSAALIACGQAPLDGTVPLSPPVRRTLMLASTHSELAGVLVWRDPQTYAPEAQPYSWLTADNISGRAFMATKAPALLTKAGLAASPNGALSTPNYLIAFTEAQMALTNRDGVTARRAAERAVRCSPGNPEAWLLLSGAIRLQSHAMHNTVSLQSEWEAAALLATQLDPSNEAAWLDLSASAIFADDPTQATSAFWKAQSLAPEDRDVYYWGLQMFQPDGGDNAGQLRKVINLIVANDTLLKSMSFDVVQAIMAWGDVPQYMPTLDTVFRGVVLAPDGWFAGQPKTRAALATAWQGVHVAPKDKQAWRSLGALLCDNADGFRLARSFPDLSTAESNAIFTLYAYWVWSAERWVAIDQKNSAAWLNLARAQMFASQLGEATESWSTAYALAPKNVEVCRAGLNLFQPKWSSQSDELTNLTQKIAADPMLFGVLAPEVVEAILTLHSISPQQSQIRDRGWKLITGMTSSRNPKVHHVLAEFFHWHDMPEQAEKAYHAWVVLAPGNSEAEFRYGGFLHNTRRYDEAEAHYRKAVELDPDNAEAIRYLSQIVFSKGKYQEALPMLKHATQVLPLWPDIWLALAEDERNLGLLATARADYQQVLDLGPTNEKTSMSRNIAASRIQYIDRFFVPPVTAP